MVKYGRMTPADQTGERQVIEVIESDLPIADLVHPALVGEFIVLPPEAGQGSTLLGSDWTHLELSLAPEPFPALVLRFVDDVPTFLMRFTGPERVAIRASADDLVLDFMALLNDPRTVAVNRALTAVQEGVGYLEQVGLIGEGRAAEVLAGDPVP